MVDESLHCLLGLYMLRVAPAQKRSCRPSDFPFHLLFGCLRDVYAVTVALEAEELIGFVGRIDSFLVRVYFQLVLLQVFLDLPLIFQKCLKVGSE